MDVNVCVVIHCTLKKHLQFFNVMKAKKQQNAVSRLNLRLNLKIGNTAPLQNGKKSKYVI